MNMLLYDVCYENFDICNDDILENLVFLGNIFDVVIVNLLYSVKWIVDLKFENDEWFSGYGKFVLKFKVDFVFI